MYLAGVCVKFGEFLIFVIKWSHLVVSDWRASITRVVFQKLSRVVTRYVAHVLTRYLQRKSQNAHSVRIQTAVTLRGPIPTTLFLNKSKCLRKNVLKKINTRSHNMIRTSCCKKLIQLSLSFEAFLCLLHIKIR
jgi:hypothetical protein